MVMTLKQQMEHFKKALAEEDHVKQLRAVKGSQAWRNLQIMLQRSGGVCEQRVKQSWKQVPGQATFNFRDVSHLYKLYASIPDLTKEVGCQLELCELWRGKHRWPLNQIITPKSIRRKVSRFIQGPIYGRMKKEKVEQAMKGSLYATLVSAHGNKDDLNQLIIKLGRKVRNNPYKYMKLSSSPIFNLLMLECNRLGFSDYYRKLLNISRHVTNVALLERLGHVLYFCFLYPKGGGEFGHVDLFTAFFGRNPLKEKMSQLMRGYECNKGYGNATDMKKDVFLEANNFSLSVLNEESLNGFVESIEKQYLNSRRKKK